MTASYLPDSASGTPLHIQTLVDHLPAEHEVRVLARASAPEDEEYARREYDYQGLRVHTINNTWRDARDFFFLYSARGVDRAMAGILDDFQPDLVHVHHLTCLSTNLVPILHRRHIPVVMTLHDFWMICPRGQRLHPDGTFCAEIDRRRCHRCIRRTWGFLFPEGEPDALTEKAEMEMLAAWDDQVRRILALLDRVIVPSRHFREVFAARGVDPRRLVVIPHGLDAAPFAPVPARRRAAAKTRVGFLGTVIPSKGVHVLLEAVRGLGDRVELAIHGEAVPYHEDDGYLRRLEAAVPEDVTVRFHGRYAPGETPAILEAIDILVVPSVWPEAFGLTVREGFLAGVPVVASDLGALREALAEGRGLLFRPGDAGDLRRQLVRLLDDPDLVRRIRGRPEWVRTPETMAAETLAVYEAVLEEHRTAEEAPDPVRDAFRSRVEAVRALDRETLLARAAAGLGGLAGRLGLDPAPGRILNALARHRWKIRETFRTHAREVAWLRGERASLRKDHERMLQAREELKRQFEREIAWLRRDREILLEERAGFEAARQQHEALIHTLKRAHRDSVEHSENLAARIRALEARVAGLGADLAVRDALLRRLAGSTLVRGAARLKRIHELEEFKP